MVRPSNTGIPAGRRKIFLFAAALFWFALLFSSYGYAQSDERQKLHREALSLKEQGDYKRATELAQRALELAEQELGLEHPVVVGSLDTLASLYFRQGQYGQAETLYKRALAILEKALGPDNPFVASSLNNLAGLYRKQGRVTEAEPLYRRSLAILEKAFGPDHPSVAESLDNLGELCLAQGRYADAETIYKRLLSFWGRAHGPDHPNVATSAFKLAELYRAQARYTEAEPLFKRALAIRETAFGPSDPDVVMARESYVQLLRATGRGAEANEMAARTKAAPATQPAKKIPVAVSAGDNDPLGRELALAVTEALRFSQSHRLVDNELQLSTPRILVMLRSAAAARHDGTSSTIETMAFINYQERGLMQLISPLEQNCDRSRLGECAKRILSKIDEDVEWLRQNMWEAWKKL